MGSAPDALERDAVQLVVRAELDARELDAHVAQHAAVVVRVGAAIDAGVALARALAALEVDGRPAVDDEPAPIAAAPLPIGWSLVKTIGAWAVPMAFSRPPCSTMSVPTLPDSPMIRVPACDVQRRAIVHEHGAPQNVVVRVDPGFGAGDARRSRR